MGYESINYLAVPNTVNKDKIDEILEWVKSKDDKFRFGEYCKWLLSEMIDDLKDLSKQFPDINFTVLWIGDDDYDNHYINVKDGSTDEDHTIIDQHSYITFGELKQIIAKKKYRDDDEADGIIYEIQQATRRLNLRNTATALGSNIIIGEI